MSSIMEQLQYPIGRFTIKDNYSEEELRDYILTIHDFPVWLINEIKDLDPSYMEKTYRPGGWNLRQLIHHIADSHINAYVRFKRAMTENEPQVHGYLEKKWAELSDAKEMKIQSSIMLVQGIHNRWHGLLESMSPQDFERKYYHIENDQLLKLSQALANYDWHSKHHLGHVKLISQS